MFGDGLGRAADSSFVTPQPFVVLPGFGVQQSNHGNSQQLDVFAKSEKWLTPAPTPVGTWKTREEEVLGWAGYLDELSSWAAGGSLEFSVEIQHSSRWPGPIRWSALSGAQQARSRRLMSILKAAFHDNPRCVALVNAFSEGVALHGVGSSDRVTVAVNQQANGFELLRQLTLEFSLRSRSEALSLRTQIAGKSFVLAATQTSPSSLVSDTIRRIDYEAARFSRLLGTLPMQVDTTGLKLADSDMLVVLLKSLPETVKNYVLHHSGADNYESYRNAAMRWEEQQRLFSDFETTGHSKRLSSLEGNVEHHSLDDELVDAVEGRCGKCGSRKHTAPGCTADMSKIRCFRCGKMGHISFNCPENREGKGVVRSDTWDKRGSKGKGSKGSKGKRKKGKLNEVSEDWTDWTAESWDDDDYWWHDQWPESCDGQWGVSQTWWDDGSGWYCDGYGYTWQQGPVQSAEPSASHDNRSDVQKTGSVGSMIINPLLFDMTCETTGGLRFVHEHEVADMETENRLVVGCKDFESELADTGCVLAESCDSCTRESKESELADTGCVLAESCDSCTRESEGEDELADMGCVLARGCDSCTHESEEKDELTDTGCVLARGCDSCTRESERESELADMGCVLARGCDSCTHEPWFSAYRSDLTVSDTRDFSVAAVSGGDDNELARHRRQGHIPFNPNCLECAKGRSVFQHRRDKGDRKEVSIQADFAFLNTTGEIVADELPGSVKILVLTEMMSRCIGYVVVGEDVEAARRQIVAWLQHFGLTSKAVSIDVHTDSERAVGEIIGSSTGRHTFAIRRAAPQQHRSIGSAERAARELKESFSVLRADLNAQGLDVTFSHENLVNVLTFWLCATTIFQHREVQTEVHWKWFQEGSYPNQFRLCLVLRFWQRFLIQFGSIHHFQQEMLSVLSFTWDWNEVQLCRVSFVWMAKLS